MNQKQTQCENSVLWFILYELSEPPSAIHVGYTMNEVKLDKYLPHNLGLFFFPLFFLLFVYDHTVTMGPNQTTELPFKHLSVLSHSSETFCGMNWPFAVVFLNTVTNFPISVLANVHFLVLSIVAAGANGHEKKFSTDDHSPLCFMFNPQCGWVVHHWQ